LLNVEELQKTLNSVKVLRANADFGTFMRHVMALLEDARIELETAKPELIMLTQGRIACLREIIGTVEGANEIEEKIKECVNQGESE